MKSALRSAARVVLPKSVREWLLSVWVIVRRRMISGWSIIRSPDRKAIILSRLGDRLEIILDVAASRLSRAVLGLAISLGPKFSAIRLRIGRPRTLWGVTPILTLPLKAKADRELGFRSTSLVYVTYFITSRFDINLKRPYALAMRFGQGLAFQRLVLAWALLRHDVFHFFADRGLLDSSSRLQINFEELAALRKADKRVYVYAYGADVRTRQATLALGKWNYCVDCTEPPKYCACHDSETQKYISELAKSATALVTLGDMLPYMPTAKFVNYWPVDLDRIGAASPHVTSGPLRVAHAPNHSSHKGSKYFEQTIEKLKAQGYRIEYRKIQGVPNEQVIAMFANCDIVVDQFLAGAYGYTALEGMALGKPVLSFVRNADQVEAPAECPIINTTPDDIEQVLLWLLNNRDRLSAIGEQGRRYVERWHCISAVAARLGRLYQETANFPPRILRLIEDMQKREDARRNAISVVTSWQHPFPVGKQLEWEKLGVASSGS